MPAAVGSGVPLTDLHEAAAAAPTMEGRDLTTLVTTETTYRCSPRTEARELVVAVDFGIKRDILGCLTRRGLEVVVVPATASVDDILALSPGGVFLSNGPGDPGPVRHGINTVRNLLGRVPIFGICLGHQILGLALGFETFKLPFGHHGGNHPVRSIVDGRVSITAQNHGFAVDLWSGRPDRPSDTGGLPGPSLLPDEVATDFGPVVPTHQNLNDGTLEGLAAPDAGAFSVQYHPEAAPGPNDAVGLFDAFATRVGAG
jgi:carbamoyl-phosphate synthase small subunit